MKSIECTDHCSCIFAAIDDLVQPATGFIAGTWSPAQLCIVNGWASAYHFPEAARGLRTNDYLVEENLIILFQQPSPVIHIKGSELDKESSRECA